MSAMSGSFSISVGRGQVFFALQVAVEDLGDGAGFGVFAAEGAKAVHVVDHVGRGEQGIELVEPGALAHQGVADKGFHGADR